jgi:antitoxin (DNA-binding transcriptional repressor) of toxin-antitoxin stability system
MKVIDLKEAKSHLEQYAQECQSSPVVVTVEGKPVFELLPIRSDDRIFSAGCWQPMRHFSAFWKNGEKKLAVAKSPVWKKFGSAWKRPIRRRSLANASIVGECQKSLASRACSRPALDRLRAKQPG